MSRKDNTLKFVPSTEDKNEGNDRNNKPRYLPIENISALYLSLIHI